MSNQFFCSNCGKKLDVKPKAIPRAGIVISLVQYHECSSEVQEFTVDLGAPILADAVAGKDKFVQSLNRLKPLGMISTNELRDRRFEKDDNEVKSTAPNMVREMLNRMMPTTPAHDISNLGGNKPESEE